MKKAIVILDGIILSAIGLSAGWFAVYGDYWLLMNPVFKWLTISGAALVLTLGLVLLFNRPSKVNYSNIMVFLVFFLIIVAGRPYSSTVNPSAKMINSNKAPVISAGPGTAQIKLSELFFSTQKEADSKYANSSFTAIGMVKRLPEMDKSGAFALMEYVMFCCAADALALGFLVPYDKVEGLKDGEWAAVTGKLKPLDKPATIPKFRFGSANFTTVNEKYVIEVENVNVADNPYRGPLNTIADMLNKSGKLKTITRVLKAAGHMGDLKGAEQYTVFAPLDNAFTNMPREKLNELFRLENKEELKRFAAGHVVKGKILKSDLFNLETVTTIDNTQLPVQIKNGKIYVGAAKIILADKFAKNGVVHYIFPTIKRQP